MVCATSCIVHFMHDVFAPTVNSLPNSKFLSGIIAPNVCSLFKDTTIV